ncbi:MAG: NAD(P)H-dependent oxidoreductase [Sarcina sp.]
MFNFRFATKEFNGNIIPDSDMEIIAQTARLSPSSFGLEPWKFIVVGDKELIKEIADVSWGLQRQAPTTSHLIIALTKQGKEVRFDSEYLRDLWLNNKGVTEEFFEGLMPVLGGFQKANLDIDNTDEKLLEWSKRQTYIALGNMMTGAAMMGIDSCAIEGFDKEKVEEILIKRGILDKKEYDLTYMTAFGYRAAEPNREKARRETNDVISFVK